MIENHRKNRTDKTGIKIEVNNRRKRSVDINLCGEHKNSEREQNENFLIRYFLFDIRHS